MAQLPAFLRFGYISGLSGEPAPDGGSEDLKARKATAPILSESEGHVSPDYGSTEDDGASTPFTPVSRTWSIFSDDAEQRIWRHCGKRDSLWVVTMIMILAGAGYAVIEVETDLGWSTAVGPLTGTKTCAAPGFVGDHIFYFENKCNYTIHVGAMPPLVKEGGWELPAYERQEVIVPQGFQGRFWPRTHCYFDHLGKGSCLTGDCGSGLQCMGMGGTPPASLAEFNLDAPAPWTQMGGNIDWYDVSLVDGYNVPVSIFPIKETVQHDPCSQTPGRDCADAICLTDLNPMCPKSLRHTMHSSAKTLPPNKLFPHDNFKADKSTIGCKSACTTFGDPKYCCSAGFSTPDACPPTDYSKIFKNACPGAYSYAYDDATSLFTCRSSLKKASSYTVQFC
mmetsp:Transcript_19836/g.40114  ORF Transcript_19836/g.40114 Transcript_19836/m.40114 type:complete len:394 (+) Transcript_19836:80-1261(+)